MTDQIGWKAILATALISSFSTACLTEPVKAWIQRRRKRKEMRRALYWEIVHNFNALQGQVLLSQNNEKMGDEIGCRFEMSYKRLSYDLASKDSFVFYSLGHAELYWIDTLYRDFEHLIHGEFKDKDQRLRNAKSVVHSVLSELKNRRLNKRLIFKVSPRWVKKHFRENLPLIEYVDIDPPGFRERLRRRYDRVQYWTWRTFFS
ncbi:MAG: hypothetical protein ABSD64_00565 [Terriglobales bacterium]|jgi:hypothetical protein